MSELSDKVAAILEFINEQTEGMDYNERTMVLLLVMEFLKCAAELDILDMLRPRKRKEGGDE